MLTLTPLTPNYHSSNVSETTTENSTNHIIHEQHTYNYTHHHQLQSIYLQPNDVQLLTPLPSIDIHPTNISQPIISSPLPSIQLTPDIHTLTNGTITTPSTIPSNKRSKARTKVGGRKSISGGGSRSSMDLAGDMDVPYERVDHRKIRHRQTDTNRRIRIKSMIEKLRAVVYTNEENVKAEQSQVIEDALTDIKRLREENQTLKQRVEQLEQVQNIHTHPTHSDDIDDALSSPMPSEMYDLPFVPSIIEVSNAPGTRLMYPTRKQPSASVSDEPMFMMQSIPRSPKNMTVAMWNCSIDNRWLDVNSIFTMSTSYTASDLYGRNTGESPTFATALLRETDPFDDKPQYHNFSTGHGSTSLVPSIMGRGITVSELGPSLGGGSPLYTDPILFKRAIETPLLFNCYWLDKHGCRRFSRFMSQVIRDEHTNKALYVFNVYYRGM